MKFNTLLFASLRLAVVLRSDEARYFLFLITSFVFTSYVVYFTCKMKRSLVSFCQGKTDCYWEDVVGLIKRVHV